MSDVEVASVLPKELRLGVPPKMPQARSYLFRQQSTISSYSSGRTIQINIPRLQRSYLSKESYLTFTLVVDWMSDKSSRILSFDNCGAWGLFEKLEVFDYLGSTVLESISGVPQLMSLLLDMGLDGILDHNIGNSSYGLGMPYVSTIEYTDVDELTNGKVPYTYLNTWRNYASNTVKQPTTGAVLDYGNTADEQRTVTYQYSIPLPSFLGFLSDKMIPLHNGFTIVLTLASQFKPFIIGVDAGHNATEIADATAPILSPVTTNLTTDLVSNDTINWTVRDVNMCCQILELGPIAESMIMSSTQGQPLIVHTKAMRYYTGTVKGGNYGSAKVGDTPTPLAGQAEFTLNLNLNVASLTNILWFMRTSDHTNDVKYASCGHRTRNFLNRWYFQYGSTTLPQSNGIQAMHTSIPQGVTITGTGNAVPNYAYEYLSSGAMEAYNELMKSRPKYLAANRINYDSYTKDFRFNASLDFNEAPAITYLNYLGLTPSANSPYNFGRFACGLNLELAPNKRGSIISGLNTNGMNTSIRGNFHPNYLYNMDTTTLDAYAEYDAFINISPGIATTVSF